ncbi:MAG: hypothetical protein ACRD1T_03345 [Acidimicrobiia bacterium]
MVTKVQRDSLIRVATHCDNSFDLLKPWTPTYNENYKAQLSAFGGAPGAGGVYGPYANELSFTYTPMSVSEYSAAKSYDLDPKHDTKGERGWWDDFAGDFSMTGGNSTYPEEQREHWDEFYRCGGKRSGEICGKNTAGEELGASGDSAPWAKPLKTSWDDAVDDRLFEVGVVRDELGLLMTKLLRAADKYANVDLDNSLHITDKYNDSGNPSAKYQ